MLASTCVLMPIISAMPIIVAGPRYFGSVPAVGDLTTPGAPEVVGSGPSTLYMRWNKSTTTNGELFHQYRIYRSTSADGTYTQVGVSPVNAFVDSDLDNSTVYYYKVEGQDELSNTSNLSDVSNGLSTLASGAGPDHPEWQSIVINTHYALPTGGVTHSPTTPTQLQTAVTNAALGDVIVLSAALTYDLNNASGNQIVFPNKTGSGWIYIVTSDLASLPAPGTRATASHASAMPTLRVNTTATGNVGASFAAGANHYRFVGINFVCTGASAAPNRPIEIGVSSVSSEADMPNHIIFDRCLHNGDATHGGIHGMAISGKYISVIDSSLLGWSDFANGNDSQAIWIAASMGPIKLHNNRLEGGSENVMSGGDNFPLTGVIPADVQLTGNHIIKPLAWADDGVGAGSSKNLLEVKSGQRWCIAWNAFENFWPGGQGMSVSFKPTDQSETGDSDWVLCNDMALIYNTFKNVSGGPAVHGKNSGSELTPASRTLIRDNIVELKNLKKDGTYTLDYEVGDWLDLFFVNASPIDTVVDNNTLIYFTTGRVSFHLNNTSAFGKFAARNNIVSVAGYGAVKDADGNGSGSAALNYSFTDWVFTNNAIIGGNSSGMPSGNFYPTNNAAVGFVGTIGSSTFPASFGDYALTAGSTYHNAGTDGHDLGADVARMVAS